MWRATGATAGVLVALLDILKGVAGVVVAERLNGGVAAPAAAGVAAVVGHVYPVWLGFRGGKGVATSCGVFAVLTPLAVLPALAIFCLSVWITKYISAGSVMASLALPPLAYVTGSSASGRRRRGRRGGPGRLSPPFQPDAGARRHRTPGGDGSAGALRPMQHVTVLGAAGGERHSRFISAASVTR